MANKHSPTPTKPNKTRWWLTTSAWLIMASATTAAASVLWMALPDDEDTVEEVVATSEQQPIAFDIAEVTKIPELHELDNEVQPVTFEALIRDLRDYPPEFVDSGYLKRYQGSWTIQVMDVAEHEIITDYLNLRDDRKKFAYFRYRDTDNQVRYVLTYGRMKTADEANKVANNVDFDLPKNVKVFPEKLDAYKAIIENYELSLPVQDLSANRPRKVKLRPTKRQIAAKPRPAKKVERPKSTVNESSDRNPLTNTQSSSTSSSTSSNSSSKPPARPIENSTDTNKTLAVTEQRNVEAVQSDSSANNNANKNASNRASEPANKPAPVAKPAKPTVAEPTPPKPIVSPSVPEPKPSKESASSDSIGDLIKDKTSD